MDNRNRNYQRNSISMFYQVDTSVSKFERMDITKLLCEPNCNNL